MTFEQLRTIQEISKKHNTSELMNKEYFRLMQQYRAEGCKYGDNIKGFQKWELEKAE